MEKPKGKKSAKSKTYNTEDSQVVTDPSTNSALSSLSMGERTGSRVLWKLWSYVVGRCRTKNYIAVSSKTGQRRKCGSHVPGPTDRPLPRNPAPMDVAGDVPGPGATACTSSTPGVLARPPDPVHLGVPKLVAETQATQEGREALVVL